MKKIVGLFIIILLITTALLFYWQNITSPVNSTNTEEKLIIISSGSSLRQIAAKLKEKGLIKNTLAFRLMTIKIGVSTNIQAGNFYLSPSLSLKEIAKALTQGTTDIKITIPEGLRKEQIAEIINQRFKEQEKDFNIEHFLNQTKNLEGYLFPDTYFFSLDSTPEQIIQILQVNFKDKYTTLNNQTNFTKQEIITLASIIERETKKQKDRQIVSGILQKRLQQDWPLQADATIQYAKANLNSNIEYPISDIGFNWWPQLTPSDLQNIDSPYNSYLNKELPPTPICNPGLKAIKAVINPKKSNYWFYISDPKGNIHYAKTNQEQEKNIGKYLSNE